MFSYQPLSVQDMNIYARMGEQYFHSLNVT